MTKRATERPVRFVKPDYWNDSKPPAPKPINDQSDPEGLSPTRYGDWVKKGIAVDF